MSDAVGAGLRIPGITAHRAVFADGPVTGRTVRLHAVLVGVGGLTAAAESVSISSGTPLRLKDVADAHDRVDAGVPERVLLSLAG